ncbi:hypothetical protein TSAR_013849 [Trichomalopsis sarcophagae]|uniref:Kazal-like domain-containing protein n=1 Tax=Trichomalopsis sarcophagae TaxID=543379 RepID=A0A232F9N2_9HYME|nr:hypothetical protein TSAR_013849 [Trichomalopsis sarcophagae]
MTNQYSISNKMNKQLVFVFFIVMIAMAFGCICPRNYQPVCDNLGKQHNNLCLFNCASEQAMRNGQELTIAKYGEC